MMLPFRDKTVMTQLNNRVRKSNFATRGREPVTAIYRHFCPPWHVLLMGALGEVLQVLAALQREARGHLSNWPSERDA